MFYSPGGYRFTSTSNTWGRW